MAVVVSAYDRSALLPALVEALRAQTVTDFEALLVDNGSTDDTGEVLRRLTADDERFRVLTMERNAGPAPARNRAWRQASAPWVAFTDDDCSPEPTWLAELLRAGEEADLVQGRTIPGRRDPGVAERWFDRSQQIESWSGRYETCNLFARRSLLADLDGFNETFPIAMGEDTDLGLRAVDAGAVTAFAHEAVVRHHVWSSGWREFLHQRRRYSELVQLMRINPKARGLLKWGYVLRGVHLALWASVVVTAASVAAGVPWVPLVLLVAWAARNTYRTRHRPFSVPRRMGWSVLQLTAYGYEALCFAAASLRYRALVI